MIFKKLSISDILMSVKPWIETITGVTLSV